MTGPETPSVVGEIIERRARRGISSPINRMIDDACRCKICDQTLAICSCRATIACPICGKARLVLREATDPPATDIIVYPCPSCEPEPQADPRYFTARGGEVFWTIDDAEERRADG